MPIRLTGAIAARHKRRVKRIRNLEAQIAKIHNEGSKDLAIEERRRKLT